MTSEINSYQPYSGTPEQYIKEKKKQGQRLLEIVTTISKEPANQFFVARISEDVFRSEMVFSRGVVKLALPDLSQKDKAEFEFSLRAAFESEDKIKRLKRNPKVTDDDVMWSLKRYHERSEVEVRIKRLHGLIEADWGEAS